MYFDQKKQVWMTQYFNLPPKWNAVHLGMMFDCPYGIIELPDGRSIRWLEPDAIPSDFGSPNTEVIWKRTDADASLEYGVIRRPDGVREFRALFSGGRVVFSTPASSEPLSDIVTFITPITIPAPCNDCVVPGPSSLNLLVVGSILPGSPISGGGLVPAAPPPTVRLRPSERHGKPHRLRGRRFARTVLEGSTQ